MARHTQKSGAHATRRHKRLLVDSFKYTIMVGCLKKLNDNEQFDNYKDEIDDGRYDELEE